jgi:hypothetical protein
MNLVIDPVQFIFARLHTGTTQLAQPGIKGKLFLPLLTFRIVAPGAFEWTPLKKHGSPDARPIMEGKSLDFKDFK